MQMKPLEIDYGEILDFSFFFSFLLSANTSLFFIIQNLSISSALLPGILPAIKSHL